VRLLIIEVIGHTIIILPVSGRMAGRLAKRQGQRREEQIAIINATRENPDNPG
jgi:hypothetical protein